MSLKKKIEIEVERHPLSEQIEREVVQDPQTPEGAKEDPDILSFVNSFIDDFRNSPPLEETDLLTVEGARKAVEMLSERQKKLDAQIRTARALRELLQKGPAGKRQ